MTASALSGRGCDQLEGFHFSRPIPGPQFKRWAHDNVNATGATTVDALPTAGRQPTSRPH